MYIVILSGGQPSTLVETRRNLNADIVRHSGNPEFLGITSGKVILFPDRPTSKFREKGISCLYQWSSKGSITKEILLDILGTINHLGVFSSDGEVKLFLLVDGNGSRLQLSFLKHICDPLHEWSVRIGVHYGTAPWQG